ncbi:ABC transporter ATP-binding protein/permease [Oscillochloris sp. ZM17-4]|uniref:ABC transporter ATP-binding protein n=1 Tax=Oscillochloris sp. ZM17-4 TaxID=2866714 RepID=UPI001C73D09C|nr:ABC transporter ATP-binding protein [Oscillochloris sp. ZM17-4]MBX0329529.1 ABC transporter ATP-binding protein/permease [Oscillochloris sp. ZM17-4]
MNPGVRRGPRQPGAPRGALGRAIGYLGNHRRNVAITYGALAVATAAQLAVPQLVQNMIDAVTAGFVPGASPNTGVSLVINAALLIVLFAVMRGVFSFAQAFMSQKTSQDVAFDLRNAIFARVQRLSFSYYDQNQTGQLMIRATDDVERLRIFVAQGLVLAAQSFLLLIGALVVLAITNWSLTLVVLPLLPIAMVLFMGFGKVTQPLFMIIQAKLSALNTILQENLAGIKVVKAFTREPHEVKRFDVAATELMEQQLRVNRVFSFLFPVIFLVAQLGQAAILYFGGAQILGGTLNLGEYQKFSLYLVYVFFPMGQLGMIVALMAQASASAGRIFEVLDAKSEITDKPGATELPQINGHVEFRDVTFRYIGSSDPVLKEVSFVAEPGQTVALLGATGSGKTTIINMLPRFYDAAEGAILIDGHDVRDVTIDSLRSQIGIVLQETNLFSGSIRDNIAFGRSDASDDEVIAAAQAASAHEFIMGFPDGYNTKVGERGTTLSGGQKQRVAIARALLLSPRLLILDDSTSSVDMQTEHHIQQALDQLMRGRTSFVIAQRISTVLNADQILVLDKGQVVAHGKHEDLMEDSPIYAEIYSSQLLGDAEPTVATAASGGRGRM